MRQPDHARLLRIHVCESDTFEGAPLYQAIVDKCMQMRIAGATAFRVLEGFGETGEIHRSRMLGHNVPIVITIVDSAEKIAALAEAVEPMLGNGLIVTSNVEIIRIVRESTSHS